MTFQSSLSVKTNGRGMINVTAFIQDKVSSASLETGLCHIFLHHTSASLILCENADPQVQADLEAFMERLVPDGDTLFKHIAEGVDDMPAHVKNVLTQTFISIPITNGKLHLGTWQGIYLWEHRLDPHERRLTITIM